MFQNFGLEASCCANPRSRASYRPFWRTWSWLRPASVEDLSIRRWPLLFFRVSFMLQLYRPSKQRLFLLIPHSKSHDRTFWEDRLNETWYRKSVIRLEPSKLVLSVSPESAASCCASLIRTSTVSCSSLGVKTADVYLQVSARGEQHDPNISYAIFMFLDAVTFRISSKTVDAVHVTYIWRQSDTASLWTVLRESQ
jgi:hypothetical protein